jgi:hypothetical protein
MSQKRNKIIKVTAMEQRPSCGGVWVAGWIYGYYFNALVFEDHAKDPAWELFGSRISKLWIQRPRDLRVMYNWDRGLDVPPAGNLSKAAVGYLAENLADLVFGTDSGKRTSTNGDRIRGGKLGEWLHFLHDHWRQERRMYYANMPRWMRKWNYNRKLFRRRSWNLRMKATYRD